MSDEVKKEETSEEVNAVAGAQDDTVVNVPVEKVVDTPTEATATATAAAPPAQIPDEELSPEQLRVKNLVITVIRTVFDPEIPVNIYELGLIYAVEVSESNDIKVRFTLTSPNCPAAQDLPMEMERKIKALDGIENVEMELTWDPTWNPEMMTEAAKLQLNMF